MSGPLFVYNKCGQNIRLKGEKRDEGYHQGLLFGA